MVQRVKKNISGLIKSVSLFLTILTTVILIAGIAQPVSAANISATVTTASTAPFPATTVPTVSLTHTVTATPTATTIATTIHTTTTTIPVTTVNTTSPTAISTTSITPTTTTLAQSAQIHPVAGFSSEISSGPAPLTVQFTDLSTGGPVSWSWSFGDGYSDTVQNPSHTYEYSGTYTVTLTVGNSEGATNTFSEAGYITVNPPVTETETETTEITSTTVDTTITAGFSGTPVIGASPLDVIFTDTSTGSPSSWNWDFGDGSQSTLENPSHMYPVPGVYTVSLTVTGPGGTDVKSLVDYISVTGVSTPVTTQTTASIINNEYTGPIQTTASYPVISRQPTSVGTPTEPTGQPREQELVYFIIIGIIAVIVVVAVVLYAGAGTKRSRNEK